MPSAVLLATVPHPVCRSLGCNHLLCRVMLMASVFFTHILLDAMWFPLQFVRLYCVWLHDAPGLDTHPIMLHLGYSNRCGLGEMPHFGWRLDLHTMWPDSQQRSQRLSGPAFVDSLTLNHTPTAGTPFLTSLCAAIVRFTTKTTDDTLISPLGPPSCMVRGFVSHRTLAGIVTPSFSASIVSLIFSSPSVPMPMFPTIGTVGIFSLSHNTFPCTSLIPLSTDLGSLIMISRYSRAMSSFGFWCMIAEIVPWHSFMC